MESHDIKDCLKALRIGTVPAKNLEQFFVGHHAQLKELIGELEEIQHSGGSFVRFISGDYGSGKTMLTSCLMEKAIEKKFAFSQVIIDPNIQLGNFQDVYRSFCHSLRTPQSGEGSGIVHILNDWAYQQLNKFQKIESKVGVQLDPDQIKSFTEQIETELVSVYNLDLSFSRAIKAYVTGKMQKNHDLTTYALNWIRANEKVITKNYSKQLGLKGKIDKSDAYIFLKGLLFLIVSTGLSGTLFILDEVETIRRLPQKSIRLKAYYIIRKIIDDCGTGSFFNTLFIINGTREFFESKQGIKEYPALEGRISNPTKVTGASIKQPIITLNRLSEKELSELTIKIRKIHGIAEEWNINKKVTDQIIPALTRYLGSTFTEFESDPRDFIRELINIFDRLKENPTLKIHEIIPSLLAKDE
jgi:hypothetical protein